MSELQRRPVGRLPRHPDGRIDLDAAQAALSPAALLESAAGSGWSYVVPLTGPRVVDTGSGCQLELDGRRRVLDGAPFDVIDRLGAHLGLGPECRPDHAPSGPALTGGWVGALSYDLSRRLEVLPTTALRDRPHPDLHLTLADHVLAVEPDGSEAELLGRPLTGHLRQLIAGEGHAPPAGAEVAWNRTASDLLDRLARAGSAAPAPLPRPQPQTVRTSLSAAAYLDAVTAVLEHIAAGDVFQVNLTQRLSARWPGTTEALYRTLRAESPASYGACLPHLGLASISPETFLTGHGRVIETRPIKGTRPRTSDPALDAALADDLATAPKDRAENVMVVDLERNDLGRVCVPGSVRVPRLTEVEAHPTVWHLVSTVRGELSPGTGYGRLLTAMFPCGSITGAPKIAAMELIDRYEPVSRGWYCGAIGFLSRGTTRWSVAIRTATHQTDGWVDHGVGGGIVADSDPTGELAESLDKAAAFLRAVRATDLTAARPGRPRRRGRVAR